LLMALYLRYLDPNKMALSFDWSILFTIIYSLVFATLFFLIHKKWQKYRSAR
jgi:uncharacterized membrane protein YagU involved in acid resistance